MRKNIQFVLPHGYDSEEEADAFRQKGFMVGPVPLESADMLIFHGAPIWSREAYPDDPRYVNTWEKCIMMRRLSNYYPLIADLCIPTFFAPELNGDVEREIRRRNWRKAFVKNDIKSLEAVGQGLSVWPDTPFDTMTGLFAKYYPPTGMFAVRKYIEPQLIDMQEDRYWIVNNRIHYRHTDIPEVVREAVRRLAHIGNMYYTIDATPEMITEINAGEGADRYGVNPPELFASWFAEEFLDN